MEDHETDFRPFRPFCMMLTSQPSKEVLENLSNLCSEHSVEKLEVLQEYILFPVQLYLKKPTGPENYTIAVLEFVVSFFKRGTQLNNFFFLKDFLNSCLAIVSQTKSCSEDLKQSFCCSLYHILSSSSSCILQEFFSDDQKLTLSHLIFLCLTWTESETGSQLKISCLTLILQFARLPVNWSNIMVNLLPGILSKCAKVSQDTNVNIQYKVRALAVETWGVYVSTVLADTISPLKDSVWMEKATKEVEVQLGLLSLLSSCPNLKVRKALLNCVTFVLTNCQTNLHNSSHSMIDILVSLSVDEQIEVSQAATERLDKLIKDCGEEDNDLLSNHVNKSLYELSRSVGRSLGLYESEKLRKSLSLLKGYLLFLLKLDPCPIFLLSPVHIGTLVKSLARVSELSESSTCMTGGLKDFTNLEFLFQPQLYLNSKRPEKTFRHLTSSHLVKLVADICGIVGGYKNSFMLVVSNILEGLDECDSMELIWLLNMMVVGCGRSNCSDVEIQNCLFSIIIKYMEIRSDKKVSRAVKIISQPLTVGDQWTKPLLALEGIGNLCSLIRQEQLRPLIADLIVDMLTVTDMEDRLSVHLVYFSMSDIAISIHSTIPNMLSDYADHLARDLNLLLRQLNLSKGISTLIRIVLRVTASRQELGDLQDTIHCLLNHLAHSQEEKTLLILDVIKVFVFGVKERIDVIEEQIIDTNNNKDKNENPEGLVTRMILDLEKERLSYEAAQKEMLENLDCPADGFHDNHQKEEENEDNIDENESEPSLTDDQKFLKIVLEHVRHFISMIKKPSWQLSSLSTISCCLDLLGHTPGQSLGHNQLVILPLVHQVWQPLKLLFKSNNIFIVDKAFDCVMVIARHAGNFVHRRTVTDVFPPLVNFFQTLQLMVRDRDKQKTLAATQSRRILARLQEGVWKLLELLDLQPLETDPILQILLEHLGDKLRTDKEDQINNLLTPIRNVDTNILWLKLNNK